jgi:hypothetical protein
VIDASIMCVSTHVFDLLHEPMTDPFPVPSGFVWKARSFLKRWSSGSLHTAFRSREFEHSSNVTIRAARLTTKL